MANSNFDKNFETHKGTFKQKFGMDWNTNLELYIQYLQTIYLSTITELVNNGLSQIITGQTDTQSTLHGISQRLE
jgi:hypothetical protein